MSSEKIIQKNIEASNVIGRDQNISADTHFHNYTPTDFSELDGLIKAFQKDCENQPEAKQETLIEDLLHFSTPRQNEKIIGLEAKLKAAGRDDAYISYGQEMKELFAKKLHKHTFSESAQKIYLFLLSEVATHFQLHVIPHIKAGESPAKIDELIANQVIEPVKNRLGSHKFVLDLYAREIAGMLFYLTGNCHLTWAK